MKAKIIESFPLTVPRLAESSGYRPEIIKHLMPPADHFSGTTPRWKAGQALPTWRAALILPTGQKVPVMKPLCDIEPAEIPCVMAWLPTMEIAAQILRDYMHAFWSIKAGLERDWMAEKAKQLGGVLSK